MRASTVAIFAVMAGANLAQAGPLNSGFLTLHKSDDLTFNRLLGIDGAALTEAYSGLGRAAALSGAGFAMAFPFGWAGEYQPGLVSGLAAGAAGMAGAGAGGAGGANRGRTDSAGDRNGASDSSSDRRALADGVASGRWLSPDDGSVTTSTLRYNLPVQAFFALSTPGAFGAVSAVAAGNKPAGQFTGPSVDNPGQTKGAAGGAGAGGGAMKLNGSSGNGGVEFPVVTGSGGVAGNFENFNGSGDGNGFPGNGVVGNGSGGTSPSANGNVPASSSGAPLGPISTINPQAPSESTSGNDIVGAILSVPEPSPGLLTAIGIGLVFVAVRRKR